jgi:hypothetical protein
MAPMNVGGTREELCQAVRAGDMGRALALLALQPDLSRWAATLAWLEDAWPESLEQGGPSRLLEELARQLDPRRLH